MILRWKSKASSHGLTLSGATAISIFIRASKLSTPPAWCKQGSQLAISQSVDGKNTLCFLSQQGNSSSRAISLQKSVSANTHKYMGEAKNNLGQAFCVGKRRSFLLTVRPLPHKLETKFSWWSTNTKLLLVSRARWAGCGVVLSLWSQLLYSTSCIGRVPNEGVGWKPRKLR